MKKTLLMIVPLLVGVLLFSTCEEATDPDVDEEPTEPDVDMVIYSSINDGDNVSQSSGLIIQFSEEVELETFEADTIIYSIDYGDEGEFSLPIIEIKSSNYITLNDEPQTFFYDTLNSTCAFVLFTTLEYSEGTGEGLNIEAGNNEFKIGDNYSINFTSVNPDLEHIKVVPNPSYNFGANFEDPNNPEYYIYFMHLPSVCEISIYTITGEWVVTLDHNDANSGIYEWDIKNENGEDIDSGIYRYEVISGLGTFTNGVFIIER
jgi:hypothetical protein